MENELRSSKKTSEALINVVNAVKRAILHVRPARGQRLLSKPRPKKPKSGHLKVDERDEPDEDSLEITEEKGPDELINITEKSHEVLFKANTVFPFTLFPDTVTLDREKLTVATRYFFKLAKITSIPVRDILNVESHVGPFFGSLHTASRYFVTTPYTINFLKRDDAIQLQRLLQGYIIAHEQNIDCTTISKKDLKALLNDLGQGDTA